MSRDIAANMLAAIDEAEVILRWVGEFDFSSGFVRVWTGYGDLTWDSKTWLGIGGFGSIGEIQESEEIRANGISVTLSGVVNELLPKVLGERYHNRSAKIWLMALNSSGVVADPVRVFTGRMDTAHVSEGKDTGSITMTLESRMADLRRHKGRRRTDQDQRLIDPDDTGLRYTAGLQNAELFWGRPGGAPVSRVGSHGGSGGPDPTMDYIERGGFMP